MTYYPSYWERSVMLKPFDFIVLGAGIIGKQIAIKIKLKYPDTRIALVDRYPVPLGASTRNAGFACFGSLSEILDDLKRSEIDAVMAIADKRYRGIQKLVAEFGAENIGYVPTGSAEIFDLNHNDDLKFALENRDYINNQLKKSTGLNSVFNIQEGNTSGMNCKSTIITNRHEGMLNSGMLNEAIALKAHQAGIIPLYGYNVSGISLNDNGYELWDDRQMKLSCDQLIIANNAFAGQFLPDLDVVPARGQILVTKPLDHVPFNGIFHSDKGYIYFRNIDNRILIGGGRNHFELAERTFEFEGSEDVRFFLDNYLQTVVIPGQKFEIDMHWSGIMAMGGVKLPIVRRLNDHLLVCVRMSGMGVALGPILSEELTDMV